MQYLYVSIFYITQKKNEYINKIYFVFMFFFLSSNKNILNCKMLCRNLAQNPLRYIDESAFTDTVELKYMYVESACLTSIFPLFEIPFS